MLQEQLDLKVRQEILVHKVRLVMTELTETMERLVHRVQLVIQDPKDLLELQDLKARLDHKVQQVTMVLMVIMEPPPHPGGRGIQGDR